MFEQKKPFFQKRQKNFSIFVGKSKTLFLNPFLYFFKKIEFIRRKIVQINLFPGGIKKSAKKKEGQARFAKNM